MFHLTALAISLLTAPALAQSGGTGCPFTFSDITQTTCTDRTPAIVVGPSGRQHVAFYYDHFSGGRGRILYTTRMPNQAWSTPVFVADSAAHRVSLALDPSEVPYVTYCEASDESERAKRLQGGSFVDFGTPLLSGSFWKGGMGGEIAIDSLGKVYIAYFHGATNAAHLAEWINGGWVITVVESAGGADGVGKGMLLALTSAGQPVMAYYDQDHAETHVAERLSGANTWSVVNIGSYSPADLLTLQSGGLLVVTRVGNQSSPLAARVRVGAAPGGSWLTDSTFPGSPYTTARAVMDANGAIHMVSTDQLGRVDYLSKPSNGGWQVAPIATGTAGGESADIALAQGNEPVVVFARISDQMLVLAGSGCATSTYCTAGTTVHGCVPQIGGVGVPSANSCVGFDIVVTQVEGQRYGLTFYGFGQIAVPWAPGSTSFMCVSSPRQRLNLQSSGGTAGQCDGVLQTGFNAWLCAHPSALGNPFVPGQLFYAQGWFRDPGAPGNTNLSNALRFALGN